ncbi:hypothetical protein MTR67_034686 [Solanum verrucosum]|uniref:Uncharacterized protein n=1 Tax=Solanum verrucosum TaxID=315347 RepID=A0AAF0U8W4_SOLVR|nr:hypothetical protein MTR67_034686 [Solanum verrucosum]
MQNSPVGAAGGICRDYHGNIVMAFSFSLACGYVDCRLVFLLKSSLPQGMFREGEELAGINPK